MFRQSMLTLLAVLLMVGGAKPDNAKAALLAVDFGRSTSAVQDGFSGMIGATNDASEAAAFGPYTVSVAGQGFHASKSGQTGAIGGAFPGLYGDYYYNNSVVNGVGVTLTIGGVVPNRLYDVRLWAYDRDVGSTTNSFAPSGETTGTTGLVTYMAGSGESNPSPTTLEQYSTLIRVSSTTTNLTIFETMVAGTGGSRLNAFSMDEVVVVVVPEPSCLALVGLGALFVGGWRRKRST